MSGLDHENLYRLCWRGFVLHIPSSVLAVVFPILVVNSHPSRNTTVCLPAMYKLNIYWDDERGGGGLTLLRGLGGK